MKKKTNAAEHKVQIVLRISEELDDTYLRIVNREVTPTARQIDNGLFGAPSDGDLYQISYEQVVQLVEEDDLLCSLHPIKYIFVRWGDHWDEINAEVSSVHEDRADCTLQENAAANKNLNFFEVYKKPYVNLFEVEIQRASENPLSLPRVCIPLTMRSSIDVRAKNETAKSTKAQVELPLSMSFLTTLNFQADSEVLSEDLKLRKVHVRYFDHDYEGYAQMNVSSTSPNPTHGIPLSAVSPADHCSVKLLIEYVDIDIGHEGAVITPSKEKSPSPVEEEFNIFKNKTSIFDNKPRSKSNDCGRRKNSVLTRRRLPFDDKQDESKSVQSLHAALSATSVRSLGENSEIYKGSKHLATGNSYKKTEISSSRGSIPTPRRKSEASHPPQSPFFTGKPSNSQEVASPQSTLPEASKSTAAEKSFKSEQNKADVGLEPERVLDGSIFSPFTDSSALTRALHLPSPYWEIEMKQKDLWSTEYFPLPFIEAKKYQNTTKWKHIIRKGVPFSFRSSLYTILLSIENFLLTRPSYLHSSICATFPYFATLEKSKFIPIKRSSSADPKKIISYADSGSHNKSNLFFSKNFPHFCPRSAPLFGLQKSDFSSLVVSLLCEEGEIALKTILCVLCNQFPEFLYAPILPSLLCLLIVHLPSVDKVAAAAYRCIAVSAACFGQRGRTGSSDYFLQENDDYNAFRAHLTLTQTTHLAYLYTVYSLICKNCPRMRVSKELPTLHIPRTEAEIYPQKSRDCAENGRSLYVFLIIHALQVNFFTNVLPAPLCLIIMDAYLNEGLKVLVRYSIALFSLFGAELLEEFEVAVAKPYSEEVLVSMNQRLRQQCHERFWTHTKGSEDKSPFDELVNLAFSIKMQSGHLNSQFTDKNLRKHVFTVLSGISSSAIGKKTDPLHSQSSPTAYLFPSIPCLTARPSFDFSADVDSRRSSEPVVPGLSCFVSPSSIISTPMLWESFFSLLPSKVLVSHSIFRVYSTECDGWSLQSLYQRNAKANSKKVASSQYRSLHTAEAPTCTVLLLSVVPCNNSPLGTHSSAPSEDLTEEVPASPVHTGSHDSTTSATTWPPVSLTSKPIRRTILGAFLSVSPSITTQSDSTSSFIGTADTFVFTLQPHVSVYRTQSGARGKKRWSKSGDHSHFNSNFLYGSANELRVGIGEDGSAIVLDADLHSGLTSTCRTFNSPPLIQLKNEVNTVNFQVLQCEVLAFKDKN